MKGQLTTVIIDSTNRKVGSTSENAKYDIAWDNILESGKYKLHWRYMEAEPAAIVNGLLFTIYDGYYADNMTFTDTAPLRTIGLAGPSSGLTTDISSLFTGTNGSVINNNPQYMTILYTGRFLASVTGLYTFYTISDDASELWIGSIALTGYTVLNAVVNNSGTHGAIERSGTINLVAGTFYPIRIIYGEEGGGESMDISFTPPRGIRTNNGLGYYYQ